MTIIYDENYNNNNNNNNYWPIIQIWKYSESNSNHRKASSLIYMSKYIQKHFGKFVANEAKKSIERGLYEGEWNKEKLLKTASEKQWKHWKQLKIGMMKWISIWADTAGLIGG